MTDTPTGTADLIKRLRERAVMEYEGTCGVPFPDRDCHAAADALEAAERERDNWMDQAFAVDQRLGQRVERAEAALEAAERVIERMKQACLFTDYDGSIGVTQDPHIDSDLFDDICDWMRCHATGQRTVSAERELLRRWLKAADTGHWRDRAELSIAAHPVAEDTRGLLATDQRQGGDDD